MNILYIWDADYPWDIRVEKICMSLTRHGHVVHIAARNLKMLDQYELIKGMHVHRLKAWKNKKINYALSFPAFFSPIWKYFLDKIIIKHDIDLIIVRDLPMAIAGISRAKAHKIPIIFDMAEDYVSLVRDIWKHSKFKGLNMIVRNPYLAKLVEKYTFKNIDHVLVVIEEAVDVVINGGGDNGRITIVANTPNYPIKNELECDIDINIDKSKYNVIYTGGIQLGRGIQTVFDAIPEIVKSIPNFNLTLIGDGYATKLLQEQVILKKLQKYVTWIGWIDHKYIYRYIQLCDVGVIPHFTSDHVNTTIPNKIFDYMACGLPVIVSDAKPMKRIVNDENCGESFEAGNASDFAKKLIYMSSANIDYGNNGKLAIEKKYNWGIEETRLINVVKSCK